MQGTTAFQMTNLVPILADQSGSAIVSAQGEAGAPNTREGWLQKRPVARGGMHV